MKNGNSINGLDKNVLSFEEKCKKLKLTKREIEIAKLLKAGYTYKKIANVLFIAEKTVSRHSSNIFLKVGIKSRFELMNRIENSDND